MKKREMLNELEGLKLEVIEALVKNEWKRETDKAPENSPEGKAVILKKEPTSIAMRIFKETEDYETQIMRECEAFYEKYGKYPNAMVSSPVTLNRWQSVIEDCAACSEVDDYLENLTFDQIRELNKKGEICEIGPAEDEKPTLFQTPDYTLYILENEEYEDGVYQLFTGYSPVFDGKEFTYPLIDMEATGKNIRAIMDAQGITPTEIQNVCGLGSLQAVYKWFGGKSVPNIDNLGIISNLLNTPIDDLVVFKNRED